MFLSTRNTFLALGLASVGLMLIALYFQYVLKETPCPLCITIRAFIILAGVASFIGYFLNAKVIKRRLIAFFNLLCTFTAAGVAARMVWLQHLPADQVPACGPDLSYLWENFPIGEALDILFRGDGNCAVVGWQFLGLSIAGWTLVACSFLILVNLWQIFRKEPSGWLN